MNRTTLALAVAIPVLCMGTVNAQTTNIPMPPALLACAEETDVLRRLACFDREVARLRDVPESVPEPAPEPTVAAPGARANPEEETERRRAEVERKLLEELERQRAENVRLRREAEAAEIRRRQQQEIETEQRRIEALQANDTVRWVYALNQAIWQNFVLPASAPMDLECIVDVRQAAGGSVIDVQIGQCNGDDAVKRAIEAAVYKASPLPKPDNLRIFERDLRITFKPEQ